MSDQVLLTSRHLKVTDPQRKRIITPNVMLHTKDVMIPVVKTVALKHSFNIPLSDNKLEILRAQNYRNNPALLFSETPSHTLYNPLENLIEVKRPNCGKLRNQSTKYTISGKTNSPSIKKKSILQDIFENSCPSKKLSRKKKSNALHFPNTELPPSKKDENLHEISSKSIKLSRKCNLSQIKKKNQIKYEDKSVSLPKIETPISNIMNKSSIISLESQSFHDFTDTVSTVSILSVSSFKLENKKAFANIENREKLISRLASNHLQPNSSEYEINVLHYENDNLLEKNIQDTLGILANKKSHKIIDNQCMTENHYKWDPYKIIRDKYSWEADNWMPLSQTKNQHNNEREVRNVGWYSRNLDDCKIKYSWQVIGTSTQTSYSLLQDLLDDAEGNKSAYKMCNIKYSWQIIGIGTQASLHNYNDEDYWNGMLLTPNKNCNKYNVRIDSKKIDYTKLQDHSANYSENRLKRYLILNNQQTQTFAEKEVQADTSDYCAKYSWHNLIKQYL